MFERFMVLAAAVVAVVGPPLGAVFFAIRNEFSRVWRAVDRVHSRIDEQQAEIEELKRTTVHKDDFSQNGVEVRKELRASNDRMLRLEKRQDEVEAQHKKGQRYGRQE